MQRTPTILVALVLVAAACSGGSAGEATTAATANTTTAPASGGQTAIDELPDLTYQLTSTGDLAFEHEGIPACQLAGNTELIVDFAPTNATGMFTYQLRAADYDPASTNYGIAFTIETEAGESQGSGWMTLTTTDAPQALDLLTGEFTAVVSGDAGDGELEGRFTCTV
ncbi:MAG TPA: hypothetical protein ENK55_00690 [Actinobacteria bacterium]|nr:hypothetical protein [Actinomycetota bacterium]